MKKLIFFLVLAINLPLMAQARDFETNAKSAFLMDFDSAGAIVAKDADVLMPPSSMIKLMTLALAFDALKDGRLKMTDRMQVSDNADYKNPVWNTASKICLSAGHDISVQDAVMGLIVMSGGDAGVVVAERLAGTEADFATMMLKKARSIGMAQSSFGNSTGLPTPDNLMTTRELGILADYIIRTYPEYYPMFSTRRFEFGEYKSGWCQQWGDLHSVSYNKLLFIMPGADGLKTGHTTTGGYGMVASAKKGNRRLVGVINGLRAKDHNALASEMKRMLEYGFANTATRMFFKEGEVVAKIPVWYGRQEKVEAAPARNVAMTLKNGQGISKVRILARFEDPVPAPVRAGDKVGEIVIEDDGELVATIPLVAKSDVNKMRYFGRMFKNVSIIFGGKK
ncbi:MAG: D-alanyl-D-alanine carboxypeptidase [Rickettsiales bacterium]|jgi:D-alanyl-D-alanine carboxypeptidase (penicillin-binding protein 5/6)|nr:D-alanyl-D-alanine carboxypeptidase [Rickettsiales bacterium]